MRSLEIVLLRQARPLFELFGRSLSAAAEPLQARTFCRTAVETTVAVRVLRANPEAIDRGTPRDARLPAAWREQGLVERASGCRRAS